MPLSTTPTNALTYQIVGTIQLAGAEISAYDAATKQLFVTSASGLQIVDLSDPANPMLLRTIDFTAIGLDFTNDINSVAVRNGVVAVAIGANPKTDDGKVFLLETDGTLITSVDVGALPDHVSFTPDGQKILVANEGEIASNGTDPEGSVSIIDISAGADSPAVTTASFSGFTAADLRAEGVRIFAGQPGTAFASTTAAQDLEPEYIAVSPDGTTAMVTLQEANAIGILDIATGTFTDIVPFGTKDFSGLKMDASDQDGPGGTTMINLQAGLPVSGLYMPDAISSFIASDGKTYYVIANEGDDRDDFIEPNETSRVRPNAYDLDNTTFPNEDALKVNALLGRLTVSNFPGARGDANNDGDIDQIQMYGARSFSILDENGHIVFDSGSQIEEYIASFGLLAENGGVGFDDTRSDNKGPEPEGVTIGVIDGHTYAFITLERSNGTMVFDVTDPNAVSFTTFLSNEGDVAPESGVFIGEEDSPSGAPLYLASNEVSGTVTIYALVEPQTNGGNAKDDLVGTILADMIDGGNDKDRLEGLVGEDKLFGGNGEDQLFGGPGDDLLFGGNGSDRLTGGSGADKFATMRGSGQDVVTDFELNVDFIQLTAGVNVTRTRLIDIDGDGTNDLSLGFSDGSSMVLLGVSTPAQVDYVFV